MRNPCIYGMSEHPFFLAAAFVVRIATMNVKHIAMMNVKDI